MMQSLCAVGTGSWALFGRRGPAAASALPELGLAERTPELGLEVRCALTPELGLEVRCWLVPELGLEFR